MTFLGYHHITLSATGARSDVDFHVGLLGLRNVKRTVLLDGDVPFYHLYYGNALGEPGTLVTSFVFGTNRPEGRRGSGQVSSIALSVPTGSMAYWQERLASRGVPCTMTEELGARRLSFAHPDGIGYQLVETAVDDRLPWTGRDVPLAAAVRGVHSVRVCAQEEPEMAWFLSDGMRLTPGDADGSVSAYRMNKGAAGQILEVDVRPDVPQGTWGYMRNTVDHVAFDIGDDKSQLDFKAHLEAMGFIDVTEPRDRNYFVSSYFRSPSGAMFEATWTHPLGFLKDEEEAALGCCLQLPSWLGERASDYVGRLEPLEAT